MKIVVTGAGQGGLQAAKALADGGIDVTVFESSERAELCYDWCDDVQASTFEQFGIPVPQGSFHGAPAALVAPFSKKPLQVEADSSAPGDWSVERRALSDILVDRALNAGAKICFSTKVDSLIFDNERVCGIIVNGEKIEADLVIDSSGALSPFRASLPDSCKITKMPAPNEVFRVYRAFMAPAVGVEMPEFPKKVYLKHIGEDGISWCMVEPDGSINTLVGRTGELTDETLEKALNALREDNPIIGDEIRRGGIMCTIPIRYPLSRMGTDGYVAVGDAAFMTIPLIGSGISNSIRAGQMLAEAILRDNSVGIDTLWSYQVRYYKEIGAGHYCVDLIKRALLSMDGSDIRYLFDNGVINKKDMASISSGEAMVMSPMAVLDKIIKGRRKLGVLLRLKSAIGKGEKAEAFALTIPESFDEAAISAWQAKADALFN